MWDELTHCDVVLVGSVARTSSHTTSTQVSSHNSILYQYSCTVQYASQIIFITVPANFCRYIHCITSREAPKKIKMVKVFVKNYALSNQFKVVKVLVGRKPNPHPMPVSPVS